MLSKLNRNQKIDLASALLGGASVVTQLAYAPAPTLLLNGIAVVRTVAMTVIGSEVIKRIVNGPQDTRVTTTMRSEEG